MDRYHFETQMNRLVSTYPGGEKFYSKERVILIWREVEHLPNTWMTRTVDLFIGSERHAPLLPQFREEISKERERNHDSLKSVHQEELMAFLSNEEIQFACQGIRDICQLKLNGENKKSFLQLLETLKGKKDNL